MLPVVIRIMLRRFGKRHFCFLKPGLPLLDAFGCSGRSDRWLERRWACWFCFHHATPPAPSSKQQHLSCQGATSASRREYL